MASDSPGTLLRRLRHTAAHGQAGDQTDGQLLERFVAARDEDAFAWLVRAHGPMVLGVCERLLGNQPDAEDAFQATFLVLARKPGSIRSRASLAGWLYAVACRTALEARAMRSRRRRTETQVDPLPEPAAAPPVDVAELRALIDAELGRLPEKYRTAVVLCDLEGRPRPEAARQLGIPEGTLSSRLATARQKLAERLARRGLTLAAATLAAVLPQAAAASTVSAPLLTVTVKAAFGAVPPAVAALTQGVLHAMSLLKLKLSAILVVPLIIVAAALMAGEQPAPKSATPGAAPRAAADEPKKAPPKAKPKEEEGSTVRDARPVVVKTVPQAGSDDVDPELKEIRVTFSKEMLDQSWSWSGADEGDQPKTTGRPYYDKDKKTCVLPVQLEPGKTYAFWLNSQRFGNFKDADGRSAVPYLFVFQTKKK